VIDKQEPLWATRPRDLLVWEYTHSKDGTYGLMRTEFGYVLTTWRYVAAVNEWEAFSSVYIPGEK